MKGRKFSIQNNSAVVTIVLAILGLSCVRPDSQVARVSQTSEMAPITVCDLLSNAPSYQGKIVAVRGIYWDGLRQTCPDSIVAHSGWPNAVNLSTSALAGPYEPVPFETDQASWDRLDEILLREARASRREEVWFTAVGRFRSVDFQKDRLTVGGYGHLNVLPAELVVKQISDITIDPKPTYDYREVLRVYK